jgi:ubiquinone/menaquinone biosynthesis C-methylase UbiE
MAPAAQPRRRAGGLARVSAVDSQTWAILTHGVGWLWARLALLLRPPPRDTRAAYDAAAPFYEDFHWLFLATAGAGAERQLHRDLRQVVRRGARVLDAGCGTGRLSRWMLAIEPGIDLTLVDQSSEMLARAADLPGEHVQASMLELPFPDGRFDVVVSSWAIETISEPERALRECARVLRPGGVLLFAHCSMPTGRVRQVTSALTRLVIERTFAGRFLPHDLPLPPACALAHRHRGRRQLAVEVAAVRDSVKSAAHGQLHGGADSAEAG